MINVAYCALNNEQYRNGQTVALGMKTKMLSTGLKRVKKNNNC